MVLTPNEAALFFKLILPLQYFANRKLGVLPKVKALSSYGAISLREKFEVRNPLFANPHLLDEFTALDEYFPQYFLPTRLAKVVLLPFQNKIVTDGFFAPYEISFGRGIKNELKDIYMTAKQQNRIIKSL